MTTAKLSTQVADVLVVGGGIAGLVSILAAVEAGCKSLVWVQSSEGASEWAQGGIVFKGEGDPEALINDILEAGVNENYLLSVERLVNRGPEAVQKWLIDGAQISFDRVDSTGVLDLNLEAAHSAHRILHFKDSTGLAITQGLRALVAQTLRQSKIEFLEVKGLAVELLVSNRHDQRPHCVYSETRVCGAYVRFVDSEKIIPIVAKSTILATGGFSKLFLHSTGPRSSRGDGIALAHRAGARTLGMEYVQFHPTSLFIPDKPRRLLTEALRGEGARLLNSSGQSFVDELAPRDIVARAIHEEMMKSGRSHVWLDLKPIKDLTKRFPSVCQLLAESGIDPTSQWVPVVPAAHYTLGGVWVGLDGQTSLPGLYACGEVACTGVHGANRLASTSLLEGLVWGEATGQAAMQNAKALKSDFDFEAKPWALEVEPTDPALLHQDWQLLKQTLWNYLGLVRSQKRMRRAERILLELRTEIESFYQRANPTEELLGLRNGVLVGTLTLYAALRNTRSVGTHHLVEG